MTRVYLREVATLMQHVCHGTYPKVIGAILEHVWCDVRGTHLMLSQRIDAMIGVLNANILATKVSKHGVNALVTHVYIRVVLGSPFGIYKVVQRLSQRVEAMQVVEDV